MSPEEDRTRDTVDSEPMHYQLSYSGPRRYAFNLDPWYLAIFYLAANLMADMCVIMRALLRRFTK